MERLDIDRRDLDRLDLDRLNRDLAALLSAARSAIDVLRHDAEQLETMGLPSAAERDTVRRLNMAIQLVEYDLARAREGGDGQQP